MAFVEWNKAEHENYTKANSRVVRRGGVGCAKMLMGF
jgi:hypothetical protein